MSVDRRNAVYVFCFARAGAPSDDGLLVLDADGVCAVCESLPAEEIEREFTEEHLEDLMWLAPRVNRHEAVIERVMAVSPVLPVRFGVLFSSEQGVTRLLRARRQAIEQFLARVANKQEYSVKAFLDVDAAVGHLMRTDPGVSDRRAAMSSLPGRRYLEEKKLGEEIGRRAHRWAHGLARAVLAELHEAAVETSELALTGLAGGMGEMALNCACLVPRADVPGFLQRVEQLNEDYAGQGLALTASGPWPPYSFCPALGEPAG